MAKVIDFAAVRASKGLVVPEPAKVQTAATVPAPKVEPPKWETTADVAKRIRQALKEKFPGIKFSVRSSNYSMGSSIRVNWTDGPTEDKVKAVASMGEKVRYDDFGEILSGGNQFVFCDRDISKELEVKALAIAHQQYGIPEKVAADLLDWDDRHFYRRVLSGLDA